MRIPSPVRSLFLSLAGLLAASAAFAQGPDITTWQVDTKHTGVNANETTLNPAFVQTPGNFVPLFSEQVDGQVFAQPLYLTGATSGKLPGGWADGKTHNNVVFVVTENATLYAFDADGDSQYVPHTGSSHPIWMLHLVPSGHPKAVPIPKEDVNAADDITPLFGDTATPVIDPKNGIIYVVSALKDTGTLPATHPYEQLLWAINVKSGLPIGNSPVIINPEFNGQFPGDTSQPCPTDVPANTQNQGCEMDNEPLPVTPGRIPFYPLHAHLRSALTLDNFNGHNTLYLTYASHSDGTPYSGFVVGYDATTLQQTTAFTTTPDNSFEAGIWMGGASPAIDPVLNKMYVITGNGGNWDAPTNSFSLGTNWPMSVLAFDTTPAGTVSVNGQFELQVPFADTSVWFTPAQWNNFNNGDQDLGAGGPLLFDTQAPDGSTKHLLLGGGKSGIMFLLDRTNLGGIDTQDGAPPTDNTAPTFLTFENRNAVQQLNIAGLSTFNTPVFFNNRVYFSGGNFGALSFPVGFSQLTNTYISTTSPDASPVSQGGGVDKNAGVFISANGTSNGLVWQTSNGLRAWDATNLKQGVVYRSANIATDDTAQASCQTPTFSLPIVSGGKAYFTCYQKPAQSAQFTTTNKDGTTNTTLFSVPADNRPGYLWVYGAPPLAAGAPGQVPVSVFAQADSDTQITVTWSDPDFGTPTAHTGFTIFRATCATNCTATAIGTTQGQETTFTDTGVDDTLLTNPSALNPNTTYFYTVKATNLAGTSNSSNIASATTFQQYSQPGLVAYWPMDEGVQQGENATASVDLTGNGHTAVKAPPPPNGTNELQSSSTGYIGGSWLFHGTNVTDRLVVSNSPALQFTAQQSFSLVAWVNPKALNGFGIGTPPNDTGLDGASIIVKSRDQGAEYGLWINNSGQWEARSGIPGASGTVITGPSASIGAWAQLALVQDGPNNKRYFYVNGQLAGQGTAQNANGGGDLWFGQQNLPNPSQQDGFQGLVDEVRVYNTVVTPAQLQADFSDPVYMATSIQSHAGTPVGLQLFPFGPSGFPTTETRVVPNQTYTLQLNFAQPLSATPTAVLNAQPGSTQLVQGSVQSVTLDSSGMVVTVTLANVANAQALQLHLAGLTSGGSSETSYDLPFNVLEGDIASDGVVDVADQQAITTLMTNSNGQVNPINQITPANAQFDLNLDGVVDGKDVSLAPSLFGATLPVQTDTNLALFKQTSASSSNGGNTKDAAVDNTLSTRWESQQQVDPESLVIDLNQTANIHSIILDWENAAGADYVLQTSNDPTVFPEATTPDCSTANTKWTTVATVTGNTNGGIKTYSGLNGNGRFVRMCGTTRVTQFGYSLFDFEVIGSFPSANTPPVITSPLSDTAIAGVAFPTYTITSNQAGTTFSATNLPDGLTLNSANGQITGTPTTASATPINVGLSATNSSGQTGTATLILTINAPTPIITSATSDTGMVEAPYHYIITANPAAVSFGATNLPSGLTLNSATGVITGIPTVSGTFNNIVLSATNSTGQTGIATLVLTISPAVVVTPPAPPTAVTPTVISTSQINLSWTASTTSGVTYSVFRSTTSGFPLTSATLVPGASNLTATTFSDSGLTAATTYFYIVEAISNGLTAQSAQVSATTLAASGTAPLTEVLAINAGSQTVVPNANFSSQSFQGDMDFTGSTGTDVVGNTINVTAPGAAPQLVYQSAHQGNFTYTIPNLTTGQTYTVVLHFAELFWSKPGQRQFNVLVNGTQQVLTKFDIVGEAGNNLTAVVETIPNVPAVNGQITIAFTGVTDQPMLNGLEIQTGGSPIPSAPTGLSATTVSPSQINLTWTASVSSGVTYNVFRSTTLGFIPTAATQITSNVQGTSFTDMGLTPQTMYFYIVEAVTGAGVSSPQSQRVPALTLASSNDAIAIDAGSSMAAGQFLADKYFVGGGIDTTTNTINTNGVVGAASQPVYQTARQGNVTYTIPASALTIQKANYTVVLHFAELFFNQAGKRVFNISINGTQVQSNFDIVGQTNNQAGLTAVVLTFPNIPIVNGQISIGFTGVTDQPMVNGIEIQ